MTKHIAILRGDGIGPEIVAETVRVLDKFIAQGLDADYEYAPLGGEAYDEYGHPYPEFTQNLCRKADAVLLGAVGSPQYDNLDRPLRPERGLLAIRKDLNLFANLRPAVLYPELANASTLKPEIVAGLDILIVRELTGDIYFGEPRGIRVLENGEHEGYNTMKYSESEIRRIAHVAFQSAQKRSKKVCSVGKANVLETTELWREIFEEIGKQYPDVELSHMYVDNAAMQLVRAPKQFDVIATGNIFGDILSDEASMLTGLHRYAAFRFFGRKRQRPVRTVSRLRPRHRRTKQSQPAGHHPLACHAAALQPERRSARATSRKRRPKSAATRLAYRRYLRRRHKTRFLLRNGRRGTRRLVKNKGLY